MVAQRLSQILNQDVNFVEDCVGDKVLVEISPYDLTRGRITYRERTVGPGGGRQGGNRPGGPRKR